MISYCWDCFVKALELLGFCKTVFRIDFLKYFGTVFDYNLKRFRLFVVSCTVIHVVLFMIYLLKASDLLQLPLAAYQF